MLRACLHWGKWKKALLLGTCWLCGARLQPVFAQSAEHPTQQMAAQMPVLIRLLERSPESFPASLAPLLTRLAQQKEWRQIESLLDAYTLLTVRINPEARVKLGRGNAKRTLHTGVKRLFLVKVINEAGATAPLRITALHKNQSIWLTAQLKAISPKGGDALLDGTPIEFCLLELCCRVQGVCEAAFSADIGQGTQDMGFRGETSLLLHCSSSPNIQKVRHVRGKSRMVWGVK